jgi:hypothetical protein
MEKMLEKPDAARAPTMAACDLTLDQIVSDNNRAPLTWFGIAAPSAAETPLRGHWFRIKFNRLPTGF